MKSLFINQLPHLQRVAFTYEGNMQALRLIQPDAPTPGSIYLGRVTKVLAGIGAAFVDIGLPEPAFLNRVELPKQLGSQSLKEGRPILVQLRKEAFGDKAAMVSAQLKLVGFYCIYMPFGKGVRFSKSFDGDRDASKAALEAKEGGWIVRSGAAGRPLEALLAEAASFHQLVKGLQTEGMDGSARELYHQDPIANLFHQFGSDDWRSIYCDDEAVYQQLKDQLHDEYPPLLSALKLHLGDMTLFDTYKLESEIDHAMSSRVWLKSGGWLQIRQTEAMVTIDVNSGKSGKSRGGMSAGLRTNLEAAQEAARQIRLRNLAGLVTIDFINVRDKNWHQQVLKQIQAGFTDDPAAVDILPINKLGVGQISRERQDQDLNRILKEPCPRCGGEGWVPSLERLAQEIQCRILRDAPGMDGEVFNLQCGRELAAWLNQQRGLLFDAIETAHQITIQINTVKGPARAWRLEMG